MMKYFRSKIFLFLIFETIGFKLYSQPGLVGCYPFDNSPGDFSGFNHHGIAYNLTPATDRFGLTNRAYHFTGVNSAVIINDSAYMLNNFSYSAWIKLDTLPSSGNYFSVIAIGGNTSDQSILVGNNSSLGHIGFGTGSWDSVPSPHSCYQGFLPNTNQWYHVVVTRDNNDLKLYIDDLFICSQMTGSNAGYIGIPNTASVGSRIDTAAQNLAGDIDDVRIYDKTLTAQELILIDTICNSSTGITGNKENFLNSCYYDYLSQEIKLIYDPVNRDEFKSIEIVSSLGEKIFSASAITMGINTRSFSKGIYFVVICTKKQILHSAKVIVY